MRAVLQRVSQATVSVDGETVGQIGIGLLVLLGVEEGDAITDADYIAGKIADLRIFPAEENEESGGERSLIEIGGSALVISQFTLLGDARKGRRPSWSRAARPEEAIQWYQGVVDRLSARGIPVATGVFRAHMHVNLTNDGPVTVLLDSKKAF